jgi:hypothetical protein
VRHGGAIPEHGVEDDQQLAHAGGARNFGDHYAQLRVDDHGCSSLPPW